MRLKFTLFLKIVLIVFPIIISPSNSFSQVDIILNQPAPGQLNVSAFWSFTLINSDNNNVVVYLKGEATEGPTKLLIVSAKTLPITLRPRETKFMKASDFARTPEVTFHTSDRTYEESLDRYGKFPAGSYEICVSVISDSTDLEITHDCKDAEVFGEFLSLLSPENDEIIEPIQPLMFSWTPVNAARDYTLKIVELQNGQSADDAILNNRVFYLKNNLKIISFQYPNTEQRFDSTKTYAWQISAIGKRRNEVILKSEVWSFMIKKSINEIVPIISSPATMKLKSYYDLSEEPIIDFMTLTNDTLNLQFINNYASALNMTFSIYDDSKALVSKDSLSGLNNYFINGLNRISLNLRKYRLVQDKLYSVIVYCFKKNYYFNFKIKNRT